MRFIMVAVLIDMIAIGIIVPVLPLLVGEFVADPADHALWYGVLVFAFSIANFLGAPLLGALSDRYGRRRVLLIGFGGLGFNFFAIAYASDLAWLIVVRMIGGFLQSNVAIANAYVADISSPEERAKRFGLLGAMFGIGFVLGPVLGGILGDIDLQLPFLVAGGFALANLIYGLVVLPESLPAAKRRRVDLRSVNPVASLQRVARLHGVGRLLWVIAATNLSTFVMYTTWVLYTTYRFGWGPRENGWSLFAMGLASTLVQGFLLSPLLRRFGARHLAIAGLASSGIGYLCWGLATAPWVMFAVIACNLLGWAVSASIQSIVSNAADAHMQGETLGAVSSLASFMAVIAPMFGAPLMAAVSHLPRLDWRVGAPMFFCALLQFTAMALAWRHFARTPQRLAPLAR
ncbi:MAG TPA: MFS transporter [Gammaproteobacteria bacterium]|nr:MFS transporter [Gammaproteobacteria bacterium]